LQRAFRNKGQLQTLSCGGQSFNLWLRSGLNKANAAKRRGLSFTSELLMISAAKALESSVTVGAVMHDH
jgi:hypothetical protein